LRARGQWHLPKNRSPFFGTEENPECTFVVRTPVAWTRTRTRRMRACVRACLHILRVRVPRMRARLNEIWPDVYFVAQVGAMHHRKLTRAYALRAYVRAYERTRVRACVRAHTRSIPEPDSLLMGLHVPVGVIGVLQVALHRFLPIFILIRGTREPPLTRCC